jgi:hypothetical protein
VSTRGSQRHQAARPQQIAHEVRLRVEGALGIERVVEAVRGRGARYEH